jgi:DNA-binding LacI/PurR family transcriptional regulator
VAERSGYELILSARTRRHDEKRAVSTLMGYRVDALLMLGTDLPEPELNRYAASLPVVIVGRRMVHPVGPMDIVRTDEEAGLALAVEHLVGLGHRRIVHVDGGPGTMASDRRRGYRAAMTRCGLRDEIQVITSEGSIEGGRVAGEAIIALDPLPTAIITYNDEAAWGIMRTLSANKIRVPDAISLVGYDGSPLARMAPRELTTIHQDADNLGRRAVKLAIARLEGSVPPVTDEVLSPSLVEGETAGPVRADVGA